VSGRLFLDAIREQPPAPRGADCAQEALAATD
jgi:hypothetical protein